MRHLTRHTAVQGVNIANSKTAWCLVGGAQVHSSVQVPATKARAICLLPPAKPGGLSSFISQDCFRD
jgi:hypothetical protein